ncbi:hypothetical protein VB713_17100 [Anabaena cylindrica UHCC 0172]|uniref:hypothetical protein n=1 Tax=Anabaena cylindrica TaxID=1165 RepID=UPI002B1F886B|nr:hypothetical protein [Anabaena cylindrica]MEA5552662.1 hypothetical protein [Anabaena cylindrica UHCC 0172]
MQVDLSGRIRNTHLPDSKPLLPLFEAVVNSIHAIEDAKINNGFIKIFIERGDFQPGLIAESGYAPIEGFTIIDNGIGFDERNYRSFLTADSTLKLSRGSKGIGRFLWLKAFNRITVSSIYKNADEYFKREFIFSTEKGVEEPFNINLNTSNIECETTVKLIDFQNPYRTKCPLEANDIARKILDHCISYFLLDTVPSIEVIDGGHSININNYFTNNLQPNSEEHEFELSGHKFYLKSLKFYGSENSEHKLCYCANNREVKSETLDKYIVDLSKSRKIRDGDNKPFTYLAYIYGSYFDNRVNSERVNFNIPDYPDDFPIEELRDISLMEIRNASVCIIKEELFPFLQTIRENKEEEIRKFIFNDAPEYRPLLKYATESLEQIPPGLAPAKLDIELHKLQSQFEIQLKEQGKEILNSIVDDFDKSPEYTQRLYRLVEQYSDVSKTKLAQYVIQKKLILELFEKNLKQDDSGNYKLERHIHEIVFPLRKTSEDVAFERQNLWIIDEKLTYHQFLASDQPLNSIDQHLVIDSNERPDLLILNNPIAFVEGESQPYSSVVIIEFKRPMRGAYTDNDNPIAQVYNYIRKIKSGTFTDKEGRLVNLTDNTPFYAYIICDITPKIKEFAENATYYRTPDLQGYFGYNVQLNTYGEILSFDKLISDAKKRNNVLFKKLNL